MARNLQQHILQTASDLFYRQGIKATGVDAIVKAAGTTKMSLYKYFPSKEDLVLEHLRQSREAMLERILKGIEERGGTSEQKLLSVFEVFEELLNAHEFRGCPFINAAAEFADENNPVQQVSAEFYTAFRKILADLGRQCCIADAEQLAAQLALLIAGAIVSEQIQRQSGTMAYAYAAAETLIQSKLAVDKTR